MPMMKRTGSSSNLLQNLNALQVKDPTGITKAVGSGINTIGAVGVSIGAVGVSGINTIGAVGASGISTISATISTSKPKNKTSSGSITEFALQDFHDFLEDELSEQVDSMALTSLYQALDLSNFGDALRELEQALNALLKSHQTLPPQVTAQLHTYVGLAYMELGNHNSAVSAFMRAIWFQSRTPEDTLAIAKANHRLGMAYARKKDYDQATELIDRAIAGYDTSSDDYLMAKEDRHAIVEAQQLELLTKNGRYTIRQDMQQTVVARNSQRVARGERRRRTSSNREKPKRRGSFSGLADAISSIGGGGKGLAFQRQETAPAGGNLALRSKRGQQAPAPLRRQSTDPSTLSGDDSERPTSSGSSRGPALKRAGSDPLSLFARNSSSKSPTRSSNKL